MEEKIQKIYNNLTQLRKDENTQNKKIIDNLSEMIRETKGKNVEDYMQEFEEVFELNLEEHTKKCPMLMQIFTMFIHEIHNLDKNYKLMSDTEKEIEKLIEQTFTDKQKLLVEVFQYLAEKKNEEIEEKAFIMGYAMSEQIKSETQKICK